VATARAIDVVSSDFTRQQCRSCAHDHCYISTVCNCRLPKFCSNVNVFVQQRYLSRMHSRQSCQYLNYSHVRSFAQQDKRSVRSIDEKFGIEEGPLSRDTFHTRSLHVWRNEAARLFFLQIWEIINSMYYYRDVSIQRFQEIFTACD